MEIRHNRIKKGLLLLFFMVLLLPMVQRNFHFVESGRLYGYEMELKEVEFSWRKWDTGSYQKEKGRYMNDMSGFRPDLIRFNNQIDFSLFRKLHYYDGMLGSDHCLWDRQYVYTYLGMDYVGYDSICKLMVKLKYVQDTLTRLGKSMVLVHTPCKGYFYPEYIPADLKKKKRGPTNFDACIRICDSVGVNQVDFNTWFTAIKGRYGNALYPKQSTHWSVFGSALAADSLIRYIERVRHVAMPHMHTDHIDTEQNARFTDDDLSKPLNLIVPFHRETYYYPDISYSNESGTRPNVIYIGNSFMFQWLYLGVMDHVNDNWQFWYYFNEICDRQHKHGDYNQLSVADLNWVAEIEKTDCIVLIYTAQNIPELGSGFIQKAYDHYYPVKK